MSWANPPTPWPDERAPIRKGTEMGNEHELLQFFKYTHLPERLQHVSKRFAEVAEYMDESLPNGSEKDAGLRKLLEAKDCAVRAALANG